MLLLCVDIAAAAATIAKEGCADRCGDIPVPYPFGIGDERCYSGLGFELACNNSELFLLYPYELPRELPVVNISLEGQLTVLYWTTFDCNNQSGKNTTDPSGTPTVEFKRWTNIKGSPFTFSHTRNKFTVTGCNSIAFMGDNDDTMAMMNGCVSFCNDSNSVIDGSCDGMGCCQTSIPKGLQTLLVSLGSITSTNTPLSLNNHSCGYAFLADEQWFHFSKSNFLNGNVREMNFTPRVVFDWVVGNMTCEEASANACGRNSKCSNSDNGVRGYNCSCNEGYTGNPYLPQGCQDIDECVDLDPSTLLCVTKATCVNTNGSYNCTCPSGSHGDGRKNGSGCIAEPQPVNNMGIFLGIGLSMLIIFLIWCCYLLILELKKRKLIKRKQEFFKRNGGFLLEEKMSSNEVGILKSKIFTEEELEKATDNYNESRILGKGGSGTVYKGMLQDGGIVAIKKSKTMEEYQIEQFVNEVSLLSQIVHRYVVRVLGCCLEAEVPLLVYEFVSNGTLYDHIHGSMSYMSWEDRLRIATEVASAIAYLHSSASTPILHRDIKSGNILLDENYKAKLADFGISKSIPEEKTHLTASLLQGTPGYMDPEFLETGQYTEKSDVYSFGVVLVEMLVGQKPVSNFRSDEERYLRQYFILSMKANRLFQILDDRVASEGKEEELIKFAVLARRCLKSKSRKRPTMNEVASLLDELRRSRKSPSETYIKAEPGNEGSFVNAFDVEFGASFSESSYQEKKGFPQIFTI